MEVGEGGDDDENDNEYEEDDDRDAKRDGDEDTKDGGEDEGGEEDDDEFETKDGISDKPGYMPEPKKWINYSGLQTDATPVDRLEPTSPTTQHFGPAQ